MSTTKSFIQTEEGMASIYYMLFGNGFFYIGSSKQNASARFMSHKYFLDNGQHHNDEMMDAYMESNGFVTFSVIDTCPVEDRDVVETEWIDKYFDDGFCLNQVRSAGSYPEATEKVKAKLSEALKGKPKSPEHIAKMSKALRGKTIYTFQHDSGEVFIGTQYEFRAKYNLDQGTVSNLVKGWRMRRGKKNKVNQVKKWRLVK